MNKLFDVINLLLKINEDKELALIAAVGVLGGTLLVCALALIFKKLLLNKKYKADEEFIKEYKKMKKQRENKQVAQDKKDDLLEDF